MTKDEGPLTITAAADLLRRGDLTPSDLLEQCLARIDRYEERVRAWAYLDRERARHPHHPLRHSSVVEQAGRSEGVGALQCVSPGVERPPGVFDAGGAEGRRARRAARGEKQREAERQPAGAAKARARPVSPVYRTYSQRRSLHTDLA